MAKSEPRQRRPQSRKRSRSDQRRRLRDSIAKELAESEAELAEREEASSRSRARWRAPSSARAKSPLALAGPVAEGQRVRDALAAATEFAGGRASSAPLDASALGGTWSEEAEQQKIEVVRGTLALRIDQLGARSSAASTWEADMVDERQRLRRRLLDARRFGDSFVTKQMGRPGGACGGNARRVVRQSAQRRRRRRQLAGQGGKKVGTARRRPPLFALKEMGGAEVAWDGADEVGARSC